MDSFSTIVGNPFVVPILSYKISVVRPIILEKLKSFKILYNANKNRNEVVLKEVSDKEKEEFELYTIEYKSAARRTNLPPSLVANRIEVDKTDYLDLAKKQSANIGCMMWLSYNQTSSLSTHVSLKINTASSNANTNNTVSNIDNNGAPQGNSNHSSGNI